MSPVLQQMFAPMGPAMGAATLVEPDSSTVEAAAQVAGDNRMGGFAAVFVAQDVPKPTDVAKESTILESPEVSAEALVDAGGLFALQLPDLPATPQTDATVAPILSVVTDAVGAPQHMVVGGVRDETLGTVQPDVPLEMPRPDAALAPQIGGPKPAITQTARLPIVISPQDIGMEPMAGAMAPRMPLAPQIATQQIAAAPMVPHGHSEPVLSAAPQHADPFPQVLPIPPTDLTTSMAEAMFQTQIDAQDVTITAAVMAPPAARVPRTSDLELLGSLAGLQYLSETILPTGPQHADSSPQVLPISPKAIAPPTALAASIAESMFQTQIDGQVVSISKALAGADAQMMPLSPHVVPPDLSEPVLSAVPQQADPVPQVFSIAPNPMAASIAESMFQTQIDAQDGSITAAVTAPPAVLLPRAADPSVLAALARLPVDQTAVDGQATTNLILAAAPEAIKTPLDPDAAKVPSPAPTDDLAEADLAPIPTPVLAQDQGHHPVQTMTAEGQPIAAKTDTAPPQPPTPNPPAPNPPATAPQLAAQILPHSPAAKTGPIEVVLNPAELGHVRFEIHQKGEHVQVVLSAERPETLDLLRRNGEQLAAEFRNAGFAGASLSFGQWGRSSDGQPPASFVANSDDDFLPVVLPPAAKPPMAQDNSRNLNLIL